MPTADKPTTRKWLVRADFGIREDGRVEQSEFFVARTTSAARALSIMAARCVERNVITLGVVAWYQTHKPDSEILNK